jgi:hypothetical protein
MSVTLAKTAPVFLMSNSYHNFTSDELDDIQRVFDERCLKSPKFSQQRRLELAREVVKSYSTELSEIAIAMLAMSMIL